MSHRPTAALALAVALFSVAAPVSAHAEPDVTALQEMVRDAQAHFRAGRFEQALEAFHEVARTHPVADRDPRLHWNVARCHEEIGAYARAIAAFERVRALAGPDGQGARASARADGLRRSHFGGLQVDCAEPARARVDGLPDERVCPARWQDVPAGSYRGSVVSERGVIAQLEVTVAGGRTAVAHPILAAAAEPDVSDGFDGWPRVVGGAGVASLGVAVWFRLDAAEAKVRARHYESLDDYATQRRRYQRDVRGYYTSLSIGAGLLAVGGVMALVMDEETPAVVGRPTGGGWAWTW